MQKPLRGLKQVGQSLLAPLIGLAVLCATFVLFLSPSFAEPGAGAKAPGAPEDPDAIAFFEKQVRPILEKRCVKCHGGEKVEGELNFATRELMLKGGKSGKLVDWENHDKSLFLVAINYTDFDYEMPPTGKMKAADIETLTQWVKMGMPWTAGEKGQLADPGGADHEGPPSLEDGKNYWAYQKLIKPAVPKVDDKAWAEHPIDAFIYAKLAENGLKPNAEADRVTLIRRASYNLTGLPPTPEEVEAFVNDKRPDAWERVIDGYLASPQYGEKWARHWMDISRYAETDGYERDNKKQNIWRYRDYLIRSFNSDKPYDRFIKEHVAGDLLPDRDTESYLATGFNRLMIWDDEPTDRVQARADYIADIVDTTSGAFLATTMGCARCHDHKKDPVTQADYFALFAFYNNIVEQTRGNPGVTSMNLRDVPTDEDQAQVIANWDKRVAELQAAIAKTEADYTQKSGLKFDKTKPQPIAADSREQLADWKFKTDNPGEHWFVQQFDDRQWPTTKGGFGKGVKRHYFPNDYASETIWMRRTFRLTEVPQFVMLSAAHQGNLEVYINGVPAYQSKQNTGHNHRRFQLSAEALKALVVGSNSLAIKSGPNKGGQRYIDLGLYEGVEDPRAALQASIESYGEKTLGAQALQTYLSNRGELKSLLAKPPSKPYPAFVMTERGRQSPKQHVHGRGSANAPGEEVPPRFPMVLGGQVPEIPELPEGMNATGRRLVLADWLASKDNPLTPRVMANRIWQHQFGRGIVRSASDFGTLGEQPTHPELINFLAAEFIERGWSVKQLNKYIMTSKAFRMSSAGQEGALAKDAVNNLFWRYNMRRLTAEEFRDSLLAANGSLNLKQFGPSIYTIMPQEVLATASRPGSAWGRSSDADRDRRSVYIHIKRSLREPLLASLDQAETDSPCPVRFATTVPTQTLITLNSDVMQEEALVFADYLIENAGPKIEDQVRLGLRRVLSREPSDEQVAQNVQFVQRVIQEHKLDERRALKLFCLVAYNLNAFMYLD